MSWVLKVTVLVWKKWNKPQLNPTSHFVKDIKIFRNKLLILKILISIYSTNKLFTDFLYKHRNICKGLRSLLCIFDCPFTYWVYTYYILIINTCQITLLSPHFLPSPLKIERKKLIKEIDYCLSRLYLLFWAEEIALLKSPFLTSFLE